MAAIMPVPTPPASTVVDEPTCDPSDGEAATLAYIFWLEQEMTRSRVRLSVYRAEVRAAERARICAARGVTVPPTGVGRADGSDNDICASSQDPLVELDPPPGRVTERPGPPIDEPPPAADSSSAPDAAPAADSSSAPDAAPKAQPKKRARTEAQPRRRGIQGRSHVDEVPLSTAAASGSAPATAPKAQPKKRVKIPANVCEGCHQGARGIVGYNHDYEGPWCTFTPERSPYRSRALRLRERGRKVREDTALANPEVLAQGAMANPEVLAQGEPSAAEVPNIE